jgi:hypothetical protein
MSKAAELLSTDWRQERWTESLAGIELSTAF